MLVDPNNDSNWSVESEPPLTRAEAQNIHVRNSYLPWSGLDVEDATRQLWRELAAVEGCEVTSIEVSKRFLQVPSLTRDRPKDDLIDQWSATLLRLERDRLVRVRLIPGIDDSFARPWFFRVATEGLRNPQLRFVYWSALDGGAIRALEGEWIDDRFHFDRTDAEPIVIFAETRDVALGADEVRFMGMVCP